ncbi:MAG: MarR family transcriptional regulator [Alphaproteobacteria bacterium]
MPALLRHARATYGEAMRRALAKAGIDDIPGNGLFVLGALAMGDYPAGYLARDLRISKQAAGQLIDALVLRGYLTREIDPEDRRRIALKLTERGAAAAAIQAAERGRIDAELARRVGDDAVKQARLALATLIAIGIEESEETTKQARAALATLMSLGQED